MPTVAPSFDPVRDSQATFRVLLEALARPGTLGRLPAGDERCPLPDGAAVAGVLLTLLDHEVRFAVVAGDGGGDRAGAVATYLTTATGSRPDSAENADFVLLLGAPPAGLPLALRRGTAPRPDEGATLVALVPSLAGQDDGTVIALSGPGVKSGTTLAVAGWRPPDLAAVAAANAEPPRGIDLILVTPDGTVAALPRSTKLGLAGSAG